LPAITPAYYSLCSIATHTLRWRSFHFFYFSFISSIVAPRRSLHGIPSTTQEAGLKTPCPREKHQRPSIAAPLWTHIRSSSFNPSFRCCLVPLRGHRRAKRSASRSFYFRLLHRSTSSFALRRGSLVTPVITRFTLALVRSVRAPLPLSGSLLNNIHHEGDISVYSASPSFSNEEIMPTFPPSFERHASLTSALRARSYHAHILRLLKHNLNEPREFIPTTN